MYRLPTAAVAGLMWLGILLGGVSVVLLAKRNWREAWTERTRKHGGWQASVTRVIVSLPVATLGFILDDRHGSFIADLARDATGTTLVGVSMLWSVRWARSVYPNWLSLLESRAPELKADRSALVRGLAMRVGSISALLVGLGILLHIL
jgi:transcriptional regulator of met regulon